MVTCHDGEIEFFDIARERLINNDVLGVLRDGQLEIALVIASLNGERRLAGWSLVVVGHLNDGHVSVPGRILGQGNVGQPLGRCDGRLVPQLNARLVEICVVDWDDGEDGLVVGDVV